MFRSLITLAAGAVFFASAALATPFSGEKTAHLVAADGTRTPVADIVFTPDGDGATYEIALREGPFSDHFLSMRPFKCLEGAAKHWCHIAYPYENRRRVTAADQTDLEYDLLFIWKGATEYGINMWNGVYYAIEPDGDRLVGRLHEVDMGLLAAPPAPGDLRPLGADDLHESDPEGHWLPMLVIE